jgi:SAM-dependent methyltransferase
MGHLRYKTITLTNLHYHFKKNDNDWNYYHLIIEENNEIPYKRVIKYLESIPGKRDKIIADLGCGKAKVAEHFKRNKRFKFHNFDHIACNKRVISRDIKDTRLDDHSVDIAILCYSMWGSNCLSYLTEAYKILEKHCVLIIIEPYSRWYKNEENTLIKELKDNRFMIIKCEEGKFIYIECLKV